MRTNPEPPFEDHQDPDVMEWEDVARGAMQPMPADADFVGGADEPTL
ncbi:MAG: hypothetical protein WKF61_05765 [Luteimonas sp.]